MLRQEATKQARGTSQTVRASAIYVAQRVRLARRTASTWLSGSTRAIVLASESNWLHSLACSKSRSTSDSSFGLLEIRLIWAYVVDPRLRAHSGCSGESVFNSTRMMCAWCRCGRSRCCRSYQPEEGGTRR